MRVSIVADLADDDPGFVGERLTAEHGADLVLLDRDALPPEAGRGSDLLLLLGSERSVHDSAQAAVVGAESELVRATLSAGIPVIGICYGAQLLAHALGGTVSPSASPEIGWYDVDSLDPLLCPPGPWSQFHSDAFTAPPGARVLGTSPSGCQGFAYETSSGARALGWQFHPEVTADRFSMWVVRLWSYCLRHGSQPEQLLAQASAREPSLRRAAHALVDAALDWVGEPQRSSDQKVYSWVSSWISTSTRTQTSRRWSTPSAGSAPRSPYGRAR